MATNRACCDPTFSSTRVIFENAAKAEDALAAKFSRVAKQMKG